MIRVLIMIAVTGFLVSVVTLSTAVAIGGPDVLAHTAWAWDRHGFVGRHWTFDDDFSWQKDRHSGPDATREIAWTGGDTLAIGIPADIQYTQAAGAGKLTISGPKRMVDEVEIRDGEVRFAHDRHYRHGGNLTIVMTAPSVSRFNLSGSGKLSIANYKQDRLNLDLSGNADVSASGEARSVALTISGSANADLAELKTRAANVDIEGSGDATVAPTETANIDISGSGDVTLLTHPKTLESNISGSGSLHQEGGGEADATSSLSPSPSPPPSPRHVKSV